MANIVLSLNADATAYVNSSEEDEPTRMRVDASLTKAEGIRIRPTNRKAGPHILLDIVPKGKSKNLAVEIKDDTYDKMVAEGLPAAFFQPGEKYSLVCDKYKWLVLLPGDSHQASVGLATVSSRK